MKHLGGGVHHLLGLHPNSGASGATRAHITLQGKLEPIKDHVGAPEAKSKRGIPFGQEFHGTAVGLPIRPGVVPEGY